MNKPSILYYSDCPFFAGCENMIVNFLTDINLNTQYNTSFLYRYSEPYQQTLKTRIDDNKRIDYIKLPDPASVHQFFKKKIHNRHIRIFISAPFIFFWKYYCIIFSVFPLHKKLKNKQIDILHINNGGYPAALSCYSLIIASKWLRIKKIVYVVNNLAEGYTSPFRWLDIPLDLWVKKRVSLFITGSKFAKQALIWALKLDENKAINIPNGISSRPITIEPNQFKNLYNIPTNKIIFGVVALLEKRKGHLPLLQAIKMLKDEEGDTGSHFPLFIFEGSGTEEINIKNYIAENKLEKDVMLLGNINNVFNLINATDVMILPSISHEDFPNIVLESMLLDKPVIGTRIAGIPEQIIDGETGFVVESNNPKELAIAIQKLLDNKLRKEFGLNGSNRFRENYTVRKSIDQYLNIYQRL